MGKEGKNEMKLIAKYLKPFALVVLLCLILLFGQAMCDLSLPNLMSDIVNVGIQQSGIEEGVPEAVSQKGMTLLKLMMDETDQKLMEDSYVSVDPQSSEAERFSEAYPLAHEEGICVLKTGLSEEEQEAVDAAYGKASYAFLLYMQQAGKNGELEEAAKKAAMMAQQQGQGPKLTEAPAGEIPQELPSGMESIPGEEQAFSTESSSPDNEGSPVGGQEAGEQEESSAGSMNGMSFDMENGFDEMDMSKVYQLIPLLQLVPEESLQAARENAAQNQSMMGGQVGVTFKKLFYQELGMDVNQIQSDYIWKVGLKMLGVTLLGVLATVLVGFLAARVASKIGKRLRHDLFSKVESFSNAEFDKFSTASLITRTTNDVQQVQMLVTMGIRMVCYAPIMGIGGIIFAVGKSVSMSWIIAVAVVVMIGLIIVALSVAMPKFKSLQKLIDRLNLVSRENLSGMMVVRAFGNEEYEEKRFEASNKNLADTNRFVQRVMSAMMPSMMFIMNVVSVVIMWVGGHAIAESTLQIGDMMAFIQYAMQIISSFLMIAMMFVMVPRASVSAVRIQEVLQTELEIRDEPKPEVLKQVKGEVEFRDVSFRYGGAESDVLEHISFTAKPGETTAFIGATGSGKSTLINLIPRFYDVTEGEILLDGTDIRKLSQKQLRDSIGYVPQKGILFSGTIASNLRYGKEEAGEAELQKAIEVAQASDFVGELEEGMEGPIAQGGTNVSGGQRQRLSIARALVRKAPVYIFDDSFSALDFKTDAALRRALKRDTSEATVLIVAQRVSTIMHAEQIIVLDGGKMVGKGTHKELLESCPEYREIAESQLQKEELA